MTETPKAVWEGEIVAMGIKLKCFVLDDGRRIIDADSIAKFLEGLADTERAAGNDPDDVLELVKFMRGDGIPHFEMKGPGA